MTVIIRKYVTKIELTISLPFERPDEGDFLIYEGESPYRTPQTYIASCVKRHESFVRYDYTLS